MERGKKRKEVERKRLSFPNVYKEEELKIGMILLTVNRKLRTLLNWLLH